MSTVRAPARANTRSAVAPLDQSDAGTCPRPLDTSRFIGVRIRVEVPFRSSPFDA
jgi:hypothetical protein